MQNKSSLKVLQFIETGGPGGAERVVSEIAAGLKARNIETAVLTLRTGWLTETLDSMGIKRFHIASEKKLDWRLPFRIARLIREEQFTVLHSHLLDSNFYGGIAARIARVPHLATEHGDVHHIKAKHLMRVKLKILAMLDSHFSAVSQYTADYIRKFGVKKPQICTIGNPVSLPRPRDPRERIETRASFGITEDAATHWLWLHVANLRLVKDQGTLIRGFAEAVKRSRHRQTLVIAGDGPERAKLERLANDLDIANSVRFLGFQQDIPRLLYAADGFVLTSRSEAMPMALLEAALAGLVLVSSEVGGIPEIIHRDESGFLFPAGDASALARRMNEALEHRGRSSAFAERAKRLVETHHSLDSVLEAYLSAY